MEMQNKITLRFRLLQSELLKTRKQQMLRRMWGKGNPFTVAGIIPWCSQLGNQGGEISRS